MMERCLAGYALCNTKGYLLRKSCLVRRQGEGIPPSLPMAASPFVPSLKGPGLESR